MAITPTLARAASPLTIYGPEDNRTDIHASKMVEAEHWASSVAALVPRNYLIERLDGSYSFLDETLGSARPKLCKNERFLEQQVAAICTGFLADQETMVTAGHCYFDRKVCDDHVWVFDYREDRRNTDGTYRIEPENVVGCAAVTARRESPEGGADYAVVKLKRVMESRTALPLARTARVSGSDELVILGYSMGLPLKIAGEGFLFSNVASEPTFAAAVDSFQANSGSPVLNRRTGEVLGVMIEGEEDFYDDKAQGCTRSVRCDETGTCKGERVMKVSAIEGIMGRPVTQDPFLDLPSRIFQPFDGLDIIGL